jgi:hypothetical protein
MAFLKPLQENVLTLLCFSDEHAIQLAGIVEVAHFDGMYRDVAARVLPYIQEFRRPPNAHLSDLLHRELEATDIEHQHIRDLIINLRQTSYEINAEYVWSKLESFLSIQRLKEGIIQAAGRLKTEAEGSIDEAEAILANTLRSRRLLHQPGISLDSPTIPSLLTTHYLEAFPTGIPELDDENLGPSRKEIHTFMALTSRGKSWWLIHLGRQALLHRLKVMHVTLEMSERRVVERYVQNIFSLPRRDIQTLVTRLEYDESHHVSDLVPTMVSHAFTLQDPKAEAKLRARLQKWGPRLANIRVKEFPTSSLTVRQLQNHLDAVEATDHFVPDLLLIDYADLMKTSSENRRVDLGEIYKQLRGMAMERNIAIATVTQSNREGVRAKQLTEANIGEDWSKMQTSDVMLSYNQSEQEGLLGLARIHVMKARSESAGFSLLITQNYKAGQFCLQSAGCTQQYYDLVKEMGIEP